MANMLFETESDKPLQPFPTDNIVFILFNISIPNGKAYDWSGRELPDQNDFFNKINWK